MDLVDEGESPELVGDVAQLLQGTEKKKRGGGKEKFLYVSKERYSKLLVMFFRHCGQVSRQPAIKKIPIPTFFECTIAKLHFRFPPLFPLLTCGEAAGPRKA